MKFDDSIHVLNKCESIEHEIHHHRQQQQQHRLQLESAEYKKEYNYELILDLDIRRTKPYSTLVDTLTSTSTCNAFIQNNIKTEFSVPKRFIIVRHLFD